MVEQPSVTQLGGMESVVRAEDAIVVGQEFVTGAAGGVMLQMGDQTMLLLGRNSRIGVDQFRWSPADPQAANIRYQLGAGTLRVVTGLAAKVVPLQHVIDTPYGRVIAHGTDFTISLCEADCGGWQGMFVRVQEGRVQADNPQGTASAGTGQFLRVPKTDEAPRRVPDAPAAVELYQQNQLATTGASTSGNVATPAPEAETPPPAPQPDASPF